MMPSCGPRSQCGSAGKSRRRGSPTLRTTTFADSSGPTGTSGCGRLGTSSMRRSKSASAAAAAPAHVEARVALVPAPLGEEVAGDARHARLLAAVDRLERRAGGAAAAAPHLDEHQHRAVERHQIDLPRAAAVVASHDRVPVRAEERFRHRLAPPPELTPPLHAAANLLAAFCPRKAVVVARPGAVR